MKHRGPFDRPTRPARIKLIKEALCAYIKEPAGRELARPCSTDEGYHISMTLKVHDAMSILWPDRMACESDAELGEVV